MVAQSSRHLIALCVAAALGSVAAPAMSAEPGLFTPNVALRDQLLRARDSGRLTAPLTMWPVTAATARAAGIAASPCPSRVSLGVQVQEGERVVLGFGDGAPVDWRLSAAVCASAGDHAFGVLRVNSEEFGNERRTQLDGSHAGFLWNGVLVTAGAVERFWGPGWAGSLILGDNARPVPALSLRRADATRAFETPWLAWLGPWDAEVFLGQLQGHTEPRAPNLFGLRVEAAPRPWLTVGASRAIQWGGRGRDNSLGSLWDAFVGRDNTGTNNEPGNQLGGFDARVSLAGLGAPIALYTQWIGEDEAGYLPTKYLTLFGAETWFQHGGWRWRAVLERVDTVAGLNDEYPGTAYRHFIFQQGYTQDGRVLGFSLGTDIRATVASLHAFTGDGWSLSLAALNGRANPYAVAGLPYAAKSSLRGLEWRLRAPLGRDTHIEVRLGRSHYTWADSTPVDETITGLSLEVRLP
ncbi:capsule assembly Wzi family protein [Azohydromonas sediminis]|uniref:capsule assembly Wzi family protein n=1 Tax=Azohydromonas sediminis TaxID=2259674 RepID=UPI000E64B065|nr:capsule assembly Wzi family protein [Azohydromonas sediminis]